MITSGGLGPPIMEVAPRLHLQPTRRNAAIQLPEN